MVSERREDRPPGDGEARARGRAGRRAGQTAEAAGPEADRRVRRLMMAVLDGEATESESRELEERLEADPALRAEWERMNRLEEVTAMVRRRTPPDEVWDTYWDGVYRRLERGIGWILVSLGAVVAGTWALWGAVEGILADTELPVVVKGALLALVAGGLLLLVSVAREKLFVWKSDPYKDVQR